MRPALIVLAVLRMKAWVCRGAGGAAGQRAGVSRSERLELAR